jgi:hydrogenase large subunit
MASTLKIGPLTRVEGHLDVEVTVDTLNGTQQVTDAKCSGVMFRGFETILAGRDPRDATHYTQRICGVCPISHGMAAAKTLESAFALTPAENGRIIRNLVLGSNFIQSHILHFYHLAALDFINTDGILEMSPWAPHFSAPDMVTGSTAATLVGHYVQALDMRRKAHRMGATYAGHMPAAVNFVPGGSSATVTSESITQFRTLLSELRQFIDGVYVPDVLAVAGLFPEYSRIGRGCGNLLAYGVFDLDAAGNSMLLARGRYTNGSMATVDVNQIREYVAHSWYTPQSGNLNPSQGVTQPQPDKAGAYSWLKSPRYMNLVHEVGPLARMWANGDYRTGISVIDRTAARALEAKKVADAMDGWLNQLVVGGAVYTHKDTPASAVGNGLTEAPRGALGHWLQIANQKISRYQIITPTNWNCSPMDDMGQHGPVEQALIGTPIADLNQPIEVLRVVHSFDPCLSCSVHMVRPGERAEVCRVDVKTGV